LIVDKLIDSSQFPLKSTDKVGFVLETFLTQKVLALPVVLNQKVLGFVESIAIMDAKPNTLVETCIIQKDEWIINQNHHYYEAIKRFREYKADCLVLVDNDNLYKGIITMQSLNTMIAQSYTISADGAVIGIEMVARNYSLNDINRLVENEDAKILGVTLFNIADSERIIVNIKLNTTFTDRIIQSLQRFGYEITSIYNNQHEVSDVEERYHSLLKYLEF